MMKATDNNVKRTFQQMHKMLLDVMTPQPKQNAAGAAIGFITTTAILTQQLKAEGRLPAPVEEAQKQTVHDWIADGRLNFTNCTLANDDNNNPDVANLRHLRNCFGHANWHYDEKAVTNDSMPVILEDWMFNRKTKAWEQTWAATIEMGDLINLAQRLLVVTFQGMP